MNRFEKTHDELKKQLASLGVFDADCPEDILNSAQNIIPLAEAARNKKSEEAKQGELRSNSAMAASELAE